MRKYQAIFFDWDGTAVVSRASPPDEVAHVTGGVKAFLKFLEAQAALGRS